VLAWKAARINTAGLALHAIKIPDIAEPGEISAATAIKRKWSYFSAYQAANWCNGLSISQFPDISHHVKSTGQAQGRNRGRTLIKHEGVAQQTRLMNLRARYVGNIDEFGTTMNLAHSNSCSMGLVKVGMEA
jgi:hypothetical protein